LHGGVEFGTAGNLGFELVRDVVEGFGENRVDGDQGPAIDCNEPGARNSKRFR